MSQVIDPILHRLEELRTSLPLADDDASAVKSLATWSLVMF